MARLYADENIPYRLVEILREMDHDVLTAQEARRADQGIPDREVLLYAASIDRAVITINRRDFIRLHSANPTHRGIIVCTQDSDIVGQARRIHQSIMLTGDVSNQLIRVNRPQE